MLDGGFFGANGTSCSATQDQRVPGISLASIAACPPASPASTADRVDHAMDFLTHAADSLIAAETAKVAGGGIGKSAIAARRE
jgi:hypothetical protein